MRKYFPILIASLLVGIVMAASSSRGRHDIMVLMDRAGRAPIQETKNKQARSWEDFLYKHLRTFDVGEVEYVGVPGDELPSVNHATVHVVSDGSLVSVDKREPDFYLRRGDVFVLPDHHGSVKFVLKNIYFGGADFEYESTFDHRSFGKNLLTVDRGMVRLDFKKRRLGRDE